MQGGLFANSEIRDMSGECRAAPPGTAAVIGLLNLACGCA